MENREIVLTKKDLSFISNIGSTYYDLVEEGKGLVNSVELFKLKIAKLAIKACTIRHGGRSNGYYTLSDFAKDIGVDRKKLSEWVLTYKRVVVPGEMAIKSEKDWNIAARVSERIAKENTIIRKKNGNEKSKQLSYSPSKKEINELVIDVSGKSSELVSIRRYINTALSLLKEIKAASIRDRNMLLDINERSQEFINVAMGIQDQSIRLLESINSKKVG